MKKFNVTIENANNIISEFTINAKNKKDALKIASFNKRMEKIKGRVFVWASSNITS